MADIKTRDKVKGTIKTIDKAAVATERMKQAYISTKDKAEDSVNAEEHSAEEYASDKFASGTENVVYEGVRQFDKTGRRAVRDTIENFRKGKDAVSRFKEKRALQSIEKQSNVYNGGKTVKTAPKTNSKIKESVRSAGNKTIKTTAKGTTKAASKSVKTAEKTAKTTIKTTQQTAKAAKKTTEATVKASQKAAQAAKAAAKATATTIKAAVKATIVAVKGIIAGTKALISAIAAGGWVAVLVIVVICLVALVFGSVFGIFFSGEDSGTGITTQSIVQEINSEYEDKLNEEMHLVSYDVLEMSGSRAVWKEVLAVYSVKVNTDADNPQEVATMDNDKKELLKDIFWEMNEITSKTETKKETVIEESDDGNGNIVQTETTVTRTYLYITVSHKSADEMAVIYEFNSEQVGYLTELLNDKNNSLWSSTLYGIKTTDDQIVKVALSQEGNVGGEPYWSWYGFESRVEWCACFVSWCGYVSGYMDVGVMPKFALCSDGADWFKQRCQWEDNSYKPSAGTIIFFDWEQDGEPDHVGIVQKCENGTVYTIEGNCGDTCKTQTYSVGSDDIYGYGIPAY